MRYCERRSIRSSKRALKQANRITATAKQGSNKYCVMSSRFCIASTTATVWKPSTTRRLQKLNISQGHRSSTTQQHKTQNENRNDKNGTLAQQTLSVAAHYCDAIAGAACCAISSAY